MSIRSNNTARPYLQYGRSPSVVSVVLRCPKTLAKLSEFGPWIKRFVINRYREVSKEPAQGLNPLYNTFVNTASLIDAHSERQDKLVFLFLSIAQVDAVYRRLHPGPETELIPSWHETGPHDFHGVLERSWQNLLERGRSGPLANLAGFSAKLLALSGFSVLSKMALQCVRMALGNENDMLIDPPPPKPTRCLRAAAIWLEFAGPHLLALCFSDPRHPDLEEKNYFVPGFTPTQWVSWRRAMQAFCNQPDLDIALDARRCYSVMIACGRSFGYDEVPGEAQLAEQAQAPVEERGKSNARVGPLACVESEGEWEDDVVHSDSEYSD